MARKRFDLSTKGIKELENYLNEYKNSLQMKTDLFLYRLAQIGIPIIESKVDESITEDDKTHKTYFVLTPIPDGKRLTLVLEGEQMVFIEFGAGIYYNTPAGTSPHPKGAEYGFTIGSYGMGNGQYDSWYYHNGIEWVQSFGTEATMPVYTASNEIARQMISIAKEVFE